MKTIKGIASLFAQMMGYLFLIFFVGMVLTITVLFSFTVCICVGVAHMFQKGKV